VAAVAFCARSTPHNTLEPRRTDRRAALSLLAVLTVGGCASQGTRVDEPPDTEPVAEVRSVAPESSVPAGPRSGMLIRTASAGADLTRVMAGYGAVTDQVEPAPERADIWARVRSSMTLEIEDRKRTRTEIAWFQRNQEYLDRVADRARYYLWHIVDEIERRDLPMELALLPVVESAFQPFAFSPAGASGLWQFMPSTGRRYGLKQTWWYDGRRDVVESTRAALDYLEKLAAEFDHDWLLAVAAYNSGEGNVRKAIRRNRRAGKPIDFWSLRLPRETRSYVPRLLAISAIVGDPKSYGIELTPVADRPYFEVIPLQSQIDLAIAAEAAQMELDELYLLNPGYNRWATDPEGPHRLLVPSESVQTLRAALDDLPEDQRIQWGEHRVVSGDTLGGIAIRYRTTAAVLREVNQIQGSTIRSGRSLVVPVSARPVESYKLSAETRRIMGRRLPPEGVRVVYRVRSGDNLWLIARRHRTTVRKLAAWNGISTRAVLRPGQRLVVWHNPVARPPARPQRRPGAGLYVVRRGDNLWSIAKRHSVSIGELTTWNGISTKTTLRPGQTLRVSPGGKPQGTTEAAPIPVRYTVRRGDSLWEISRRFDVSVASLRAWNGLGLDGQLQPGQTLKVRAPGTEKI
jgi:membrane-bound lytic murein transglycosylase D